PGQALSELDGVHALTDITGFGLLGHALELCRGARLSARLSMAAVPLIGNVRELAAQGLFTGASGRNWAAYGASVKMDASLGEVGRALLTDPQTSGGLLVACSPDTVEQVLEVFRRDGFEQAAVVGELAAGDPVVNVQP